jgi:ferritin
MHNYYELGADHAMMISKDMERRLNEQMNLEFSSFYSYLAMEARCKSLSLTGCAYWFSLQAEEERVHAMKIYNYLLDVDATVTLLPLAQPQTEVSTMVELFELALQHEQKVTRAIKDLMKFTVQDEDYATHSFLQWFITEQVEEESSVRDIVERLKLVGNSGEGLLIIDHELGSRTAEKDDE